MAYDLALRRLIPECYSRDERPSCLPPADAGSRGMSLFGWQAAGLALVVIGVAACEKLDEDHKIVRQARRDDLRATQEMPAVTMRELVYGRDE